MNLWLQAAVGASTSDDRASGYPLENLLATVAVTEQVIAIGPVPSPESFTAGWARVIKMFDDLRKGSNPQLVQLSRRIWFLWVAFVRHQPRPPTQDRTHPWTGHLLHVGIPQVIHPVIDLLLGRHLGQLDRGRFLPGGVFGNQDFVARNHPLGLVDTIVIGNPGDRFPLAKTFGSRRATVRVGHGAVETARSNILGHKLRKLGGLAAEVVCIVFAGISGQGIQSQGQTFLAELHGSISILRGSDGDTCHVPASLVEYHGSLGKLFLLGDALLQPLSTTGDEIFGLNMPGGPVFVGFQLI